MTYDQIKKFDPDVEEIEIRIMALLLSRRPFDATAVRCLTIEPELKKLAAEKRVPVDWYDPARGRFMRMLERGRK